MTLSFLSTSPDELQTRSGGTSLESINEAALSRSDPERGLSWIDVGAGTGELLRTIHTRWNPRSLTSVDILPWLASDLAPVVEQHVGDALDVLPSIEPADRVIIVETIEHLEAPWKTLRLCAGLVRPGGRLVITTPNITSLRHRIELLLRGHLTSFRPEAPQHLTPALRHVMELILRQEGLEIVAVGYAGEDIIPFARGRTWPAFAGAMAPSLLRISVVVAAERPLDTTPSQVGSRVTGRGASSSQYARPGPGVT
jgi:SAM-dependent methyltransferase